MPKGKKNTPKKQPKPKQPKDGKAPKGKDRDRGIDTTKIP